MRFLKIKKYYVVYKLQPFEFLTVVKFSPGCYATLKRPQKVLCANLALTRPNKPKKLISTKIPIPPLCVTLIKAGEYHIYLRKNLQLTFVF